MNFLVMFGTVVCCCVYQKAQYQITLNTAAAVVNWIEYLPISTTQIILKANYFAEDGISCDIMPHAVINVDISCKHDFIMLARYRFDNLPISCQQVSLESDDTCTRFVNLPQYLQRVNINTKHVYDIKMRTNRRMPNLFINVTKMPRYVNYMKYGELAIGYKRNVTNNASHYISAKCVCNIIKGYHRTDYDSKDIETLEFEYSPDTAAHICSRLLSDLDNVQPQLRILRILRILQDVAPYDISYELVNIPIPSVIDKSSRNSKRPIFLHNTGLKLMVPKINELD